MLETKAFKLKFPWLLMFLKVLGGLFLFKSHLFSHALYSNGLPYAR